MSPSPLTTPALAAALLVGLTAASGCDQSGTATDTTTTTESTGYGSALDSAVGDATAAGESLVEEGEGLMDDAGDRAGAMADDASDAMGDAQEKGAALMDESSATLEKMGEQAGEMASGLSAEMQTRVSELMTQARDAIGEENVEAAQNAINQLQEMELPEPVKQAVAGLQERVNNM